MKNHHQANTTELVPNKIGGESVVCFVKIDKNIRHTGNTKQFVRGVLMGPAYGLAICKCQNDDGYYLFGCDENWNAVTDTHHDTIEDSIDQAEFEYQGTIDKWIKK